MPRAAAALRGALLTAADVPGAAPGPMEKATDVSSCFPGNPVGARNNPNEVAVPTLGIVQGRLQRTYRSSAIGAGPEQASGYVATFASPAGTACLINVIKAVIASRSKAGVDPSGLSGAVKPVAVADGGALLTVKGNLRSKGASTPAAFDLLVFRKGNLVIVVSAIVLGGAPVPGQAQELAQKIAVRLP